MVGIPRKNEFGEYIIYVIFTVNEYISILQSVITENVKDYRVQTLPTEGGTIFVTRFDFEDYSNVIRALEVYSLGFSKYRDTELLWELTLLK